MLGLILALMDLLESHLLLLAEQAHVKSLRLLRSALFDLLLVRDHEELLRHTQHLCVLDVLSLFVLRLLLVIVLLLHVPLSLAKPGVFLGQVVVEFEVEGSHWRKLLQHLGHQLLHVLLQQSLLQVLGGALSDEWLREEQRFQVLKDQVRAVVLGFEALEQVDALV